MSFLINPYRLAPAGFTDVSLFTGADDGFIYHLDDASTMWSDTGRTTNVTDGGTVAAIDDILGNYDSAATAAAAARPQWNSGAGCLFDGTDDYFRVTGITPAFGTNVTFAAYVRVDTAASAAFKIAVGSQSGTSRGWLAHDTAWRASGGVGALAGGTHFGGSDLRSASTYYTIALDWDNGSVQDSRLYVDGSNVATNTWTGSVSTNEIRIGARGTGASTQDLFWDGDIKFALVIDRVLTPTEHSDLHTYWSGL